MATPLSRLHALVPPPANPFYSSGDWSLVEQELGLRLPDDYKQLIESYGQGMFQGRRKYSGLNITSFLCPVSPVMLAEEKRPPWSPRERLHRRTGPGATPHLAPTPLPGPTEGPAMAALAVAKPVI